MNNLAKIALVFALATGLATNVSANNTKDVRGEQEERSERKPGFFQKILNATGRASLAGCTVTAINGMTLTCTVDGVTYTIQMTEGTNVRRKFWGAGALSEMKVGDKINVIGSWADDAHTTINAKLVRDISIQMRFGVFFGKVLSLSSDGWVMATDKRGNQTVTVDSDTKFVNRKDETISKSDVTVDHRVRVKGLWNNEQNTLTKVEQVKDFSIPVQVEGEVRVKATE